LKSALYKGVDPVSELSQAFVLTTVTNHVGG